MAVKIADKSKGTAKRKATPASWKKGQSGNPKGAPRRGESWAEIIKRVGEMTPGEAAQQSLELAQKLLSIGEGVTLKEAVVLRVYAALLFDPDARMLNAVMDRAEGKVKQPFSLEDKEIENAIEFELARLAAGKQEAITLEVADYQAVTKEAAPV